MQEYADFQSKKPSDLRGLLESATSDYQKAATPALHQTQRPEGAQFTSSIQQQQPFSHGMMEHMSYEFSSKNVADPNMEYYCQESGRIGESAASSSNFEGTRYNPSAPTFSSPPNSPLVGLVFDPSSPNYTGPAPASSNECRNSANEHRGQIAWPSAAPEQIMPIGTGARKKIIKSQSDRRCYYGDQQFHHDRYYTKTEAGDNMGIRKSDVNLTSESTSSLDFLAEGERMVSELCNIPEIPQNQNTQNQYTKPNCFVVAKDRSKPSESMEILLNCLDKIVIHDQIPNEIVQLAIEACTDAENIAIAHHNRPCFKNIHSICAKTRSNVQKSDSAVANLHSQGIPWVIKNFIFSFVRILDGWKGVKELLCEKHDTFSRIENKYYSPNIRECFVQWQAVTKEMLSHIYKTFKCLDHGFTMEQKSFTHNYYASNPTAPRHQNQSKYQPPKAGVNPLRPTNVSSQIYAGPSGHWFQNKTHLAKPHFTEPLWPIRSTGACKKYPIFPSTPNPYPPSNQNDQSDNHQYKCHFRYEPGYLRESKPRQSWTITSVQESRAVDKMGHAEHRELYSHQQQNNDAEINKGSCPALMEVKSKMIPLSHVEKTLIPNMASSGDARACYIQKNNSCGDTKEETDFFTNWGQMLQKEPSQYTNPQPHDIQVPPSNVVSFSTNIVGPVQLVDPNNDEFRDQSKVYMKPGSYKVPTKPSDSLPPFPGEVYNSTADEVGSANIKIPTHTVSTVSRAKYSMDSWPCLLSKRHDDGSFTDEQKEASRPHADARGAPEECTDQPTGEPSDRAWEAAKQSAPKLMGFIHDVSKSDTARLYNALGLSAMSDDCYDQYTVPSENATSLTHPSIQNLEIWNQRKNNNLTEPISPNDIGTNCKSRGYLMEGEKKTGEEHFESKKSESKDHNRVRDEQGSYKKNIERSKISVSGVWYHPKKNKPVPTATTKKFEQILSNLSNMTESIFIQNDMDMKSAPRFYEVVKYPMCLNDIGTKLRNAAYTDTEQVASDFRRIFKNVRVYLKTYPDATMKRNVTKVSYEFEKMLAEVFPKCDFKGPAQADNATLGAAAGGGVLPAALLASSEDKGSSAT